MKRSKKKAHLAARNKPARGVMTRQTARATMKREVGSNNIQHLWEDTQINRYGYLPWFNMRVACDSRKRDPGTLAILFGRKLG